MVQLSLALACLLAGADAFGVVPPEATKSPPPPTPPPPTPPTPSPPTPSPPTPECECQDMWIDEDCSGTTQKGCPITNCEGDTRSWCYLKATPCTVGPDDKTYDYYYGGYDNDPTTIPNWMYCKPASPASPAFIVHNEVGWCQSDLDDMMWEGMLDGEGLLDGENSEDTRTIAGGGLTADDCWTACQAKYPVVGSTHEFGNDGKETWCFCQNGCECMNEVGESNTLAPPGWKAADACVIDVVETVSSAIKCSGGEYPEEIGWSLICDDGTTLSGGAPFSDDLAVALDATCTLEMTDAEGDGWEGNEAGTWAQWSGFGQIFSMVPEDLYQRTETFVVQAPEVPEVPKFSEYNDKCAPSENDFPAWTLEGTFVGTAKECWEKCQRHGEENSGDNPNPVPSHQFLDWTKSGGGTECYCKTSCDCFDEEGEGACNTPLNNGAAGVGVLTNNAQNGECACEGQDFNEVQCNAIGCCNFGGAPADGGDGCSSAVGPGPCSSRRRLQEEPAAHTTLALPDWEGCTAPVVKTVSSTIICTQGSYPDEIGWSLSCDDDTTLSGLGEAWGGLTLGSVEEGKALAVALGAACTLEMTGTLEDSWQSAVWSGFGQSFSIETGDESYTVRAFPLGDLDTTYIKTIDFVVQAPEDLS